MKKRKWWKLLDWSRMRFTFENQTSKEMQDKVLKEGYWSLGQGIFEQIDFNKSFVATGTNAVNSA